MWMLREDERSHPAISVRRSRLPRRKREVRNMRTLLTSVALSLALAPAAFADGLKCDMNGRLRRRGTDAGSQESVGLHSHIGLSATTKIDRRISV
jgi:hypothetical protein